MKSLDLIICNRTHKLISDDGEMWTLAQQIDKYILREWQAHTLDYWRQRGVINNHEEKNR